MNIFSTLRYVEIETCSSCTRKCSWCLFGNYSNTRPNENRLLEIETIKRVFEDLRENKFRGTIALYSINEPLLDDRIKSGELLSICKEVLGNTVKISLTTNGDLINKSILEKLFSCGLNKLKISCYDDESYGKAQIIQQVDGRVIILDQRRYQKGEFESNRGGSVNSLRNSNISFSDCYMPKYRTVVGWDGQVRICPHEMLARISLGNVHENKLSDLLMSEKAIILRNALENNRKQIHPCNLCNIKGDESYMQQHIE